MLCMGIYDVLLRQNPSVAGKLDRSGLACTLVTMCYDMMWFRMDLFDHTERGKGTGWGVAQPGSSFPCLFCFVFL